MINLFKQIKIKILPDKVKFLLKSEFIHSIEHLLYSKIKNGDKKFNFIKDRQTKLLSVGEQKIQQLLEKRAGKC